MNKTLAAAALVALAIPAGAFAQKVGGAVVAVVDTARIYRECTACKAAQAQLTSQLDAIRTRTQGQAQALQAEAQPVQVAVNALAGKQPDAALQVRIKAIQSKQDVLNQGISRDEENLRSIQANVSRQINAKLGPIIDQVMTARGANLAMDKNATLASAAALEVTGDVLTALNAQLLAVSVTPLPQTPAAAPAAPSR